MLRLLDGKPEETVVDIVIDDRVAVVGAAELLDDDDVTKLKESEDELPKF